MPILGSQLELERCPHCLINKPGLVEVAHTVTNSYKGNTPRYWRFYQCKTCGNVVTAFANGWEQDILGYFPSIESVDDSLPLRAKEYLKQSIESKHAPAGSIMLAASSVDAMLKVKGFKDGTLNSRIQKAAEDGLLTDDLAEWAHEVRLDANDQRHDDEEVALPTSEDAQRCIDFASALGEYLFVLPEKVRRGKESASNE